MGLGSTIEPAAEVEAEGNGFFGVGMGEALDQLSHPNLDSQFLAQFARQAGLEALVFLPFASRGLPESPLIRLRAALSDEQFALAEDEAGSHLDFRARFGDMCCDGVHLTYSGRHS